MPGRLSEPAGQFFVHFDAPRAENLTKSDSLFWKLLIGMSHDL